MIDVRCGAMQSIATQATLIAGFAFGSLQPDILDSLWSNNEASWLQWPFSIVFILCAATAFASSALHIQFEHTITVVVLTAGFVAWVCSGIWVIYMSLYAGWRAQFSALQGGMDGVLAADAVDESLQIILLTTERVAMWFSTALAFTAVSTTLLAFAHLPWVSIGLLVIFAFFSYDGATFRRKIDRRFKAMGDGAAERARSDARYRE